MLEFEVALRLIVIGQELLIAVIFLFGSGSKSARISGALLLVSVAAHLYTNEPSLSGSVPKLLPLVAFFSIALPYFLWSFAKCVFDSPLPGTRLISTFVAIGLAYWVIFLLKERVSKSLVEAAFTLSRFVLLFIVVNTLWISATGRPDDLLEQRRRFRTVFVVLVSIMATAVLITEIVIGTAAPPGWLSMLNVILIGGLTMGLAIPLLKLNEDLIPIRGQWCGAEPVAEQASLGAADRVLHDKLKAAMDSGSYRQSGLTIRSLGEELGYPEHHLRRLINRHLGYRNFSAFLNSYRIGEAKDRLADPERARTPVLTIALDLGYGSLGPFNRAFKAMTDMTPTEFRERAIPADSE
jgi:AraC-like DNA-binding protein